MSVCTAPDQDQIGSANRESPAADDPKGGSGEADLLDCASGVAESQHDVAPKYMGASTTRDHDVDSWSTKISRGNGESPAADDPEGASGEAGLLDGVSVINDNVN